MVLHRLREGRPVVAQVRLAGADATGSMGSVFGDEDVEFGEGFVEVVVEDEEFVEVGDFEDLVQFGADAGDDDLAFDGVHGALELKQDAEGLGGHEADGGELEDEFAGVLFFDEVEEVAAEGFDVGGVENGDVLEADDRDIAVGLDEQFVFHFGHSWITDDGNTGG